MVPLKIKHIFQDKEQELSKRNETIRRLKNDLHQIEQFSEEHVRRTKTEADKQQVNFTGWTLVLHIYI